ncbi:MAG: hypothetical protein GY822_24855 [Deltaproteobacteria bacterium]|nr:hypothetical protein [Deltaproteobacteria bacterium]
MAKINASALYGFMLRLLSAKMTINGTASRWKQLHGGTTLETVSEGSDHDLVIRLSFPEHEFQEPHSVFYQGVFQAVLNEAREEGVVGLGRLTKTSIEWPLHFD